MGENQGIWWEVSRFKKRREFNGHLDLTGIEAMKKNIEDFTDLIWEGLRI